MGMHLFRPNLKLCRKKRRILDCFDVCSWTKNAPVLNVMCYVSFCFRDSDQSVGHVGSKFTLVFRDFLDNGWLNPDRSKTVRLTRVCSIDLATCRGQKSRSQKLVRIPIRSKNEPFMTLFRNDSRVWERARTVSLLATKREVFFFPQQQQLQDLWFLRDSRRRLQN